MIEDGKTTVGLIVDCDVDGFTSSSVFYRWYTELCGGKIIPFIHEKKHCLSRSHFMISVQVNSFMEDRSPHL